MTIIIGISGKIGSGKNYLADKIIEKLGEEGKTSAYGSFAFALKDEMNQIMRAYYPYLASDDILSAIHAIAHDFKISSHHVACLLNMVKDDLKNNPNLDSTVDRTEGVRRALQYLGTDIRRATNDNYWVDSFHGSLNTSVDCILATDARFPNEADSVNNSGGVMIRIEIPAEVIAERTSGRDGLLYSADALSHPSETALDSYESFDFYVGETFDISEVISKINKAVSLKALREDKIV